MNHINHLFFDLDHTLWDFDKNSEEAIYEIFHAYQLNKSSKIPSFERFMKKYREVNDRYWNLYQQDKVTKKQIREGRFTDTLHFFKIEDAQPKGIEFGEKYVQISPTKTHLFPNTHQVLKQLQKTHQLHIITNGFTEVQYLKLEKSQLNSYFNTVVCSEETGKKKPHKDVFHFALNKAQAQAKESLMIGDNEEADVIGAKKSGLDAIWFNPKQKKSKHNHMVVKDLIEIPMLVDKINLTTLI